MEFNSWESLLPPSSSSCCNLSWHCAGGVELLSFSNAEFPSVSPSSSSDDPDWEMEERDNPTYDVDGEWEAEDCGEEVHTDLTYYDEEDDEGADMPEGSRLQKNEKERERVKYKKDSLRELVMILKKSNLINESDKKRRFTEAYTVSMTTALIKVLEQQAHRRRHAGVVTTTTTTTKRQQLVGGGGGGRKKRTSNAFINFSIHFRPCFVQLLKAHHAKAGKNPSQKVVQRLAADVWHKLPQSSKVGCDWESGKVASQVTELAKSLLFSTG